MNFYLKLACKSCSINQFDNSLSVFDILESLGAPSVPFFLPQLNIIYLSTKESSEPQLMPVSIEIKNNKQSLGRVEATVDYKDQNRNRLIVNVPGLIVNEFGELTFILNYAQNKKQESFSVLINKVEGQPIALVGENISPKKIEAKKK
jgi:hypothetical protein